MSVKELKRQTKAITKVISGAVTIQAKGKVSDKDLSIAQEMSASVVEKNCLGPGIIIVALTAWLNAPDVSEQPKSGGTPLADITPVTAALASMADLMNGADISEDLAISLLSKKLKLQKGTAKRYYAKLKQAIGSKQDVECITGRKLNPKQKEKQIN